MMIKYGCLTCVCMRVRACACQSLDDDVCDNLVYFLVGCDLDLFGSDLGLLV